MSNETNKETNTQSSPNANVAHGREALIRLQSQIAALTPDQLHTVNADVSTAVTRALGAAPIYAANRSIIERECPGADFQSMDEMRDRAFAAETADADFVWANSPPAGIEDLAKDVIEARTILGTILAMLEALEIIPRDQTPPSNGGRGYRDSAHDVIGQVGVLIHAWDVVGSKCPVTRERLEQYQALAEDLLDRVGVREVTPERATEIAETRVRAFTLLDKAYEEVRRVLTYLHWYEGDVDSFAPSLRWNAGPRKKSADAENKAQPATPATPGAPSAPSPVDPTKPAEPSKVMVTSVPTTPAPSGLPRSNPYSVA